MTTRRASAPGRGRILGPPGASGLPDDGSPGEDPGPGRRRFLALAGAAAGAAPLAGMLRHGHRGAASPQAGPGNADWMALRSALSTHKLIRPASKSYSTAKELFDPRFDFKRPAGIAYCASPRDVSACLAFVRKFGLPVAARSGGHSYAGWSSPPGMTGLMVDVTAMNSFQVGSGQTVRVGTGLHLIDFYNRLAARGLAVPGGSCPTVGVAGLALGGGVGVLGRAFGLTSDALESVQIVTADGTVRSCNATEQQRPVLGLPRRGRRQLRHRHRVHVPHPPAVPAGGVLPVLALVPGGQGGGGLAVLGALSSPTPCGPTCT